MKVSQSTASFDDPWTIFLCENMKHVIGEKVVIRSIELETVKRNELESQNSMKSDN
jgi:hypothetical protein